MLRGRYLDQVAAGDTRDQLAGGIRTLPAARLLAALV